MVYNRIYGTNEIKDSEILELKAPNFGIVVVQGVAATEQDRMGFDPRFQSFIGTEELKEEIEEGVF